MFIIIVIYILLVIFCVCGLISSVKHEKEKKKLVHASDYSFKTKNGSYSFLYMIKKFNINGQNKIKIIIDPVLGFSDLINTSDLGNTCLRVQIECKDLKCQKIENYEFNFDPNNFDINNPLCRTLNPNVEFVTELDFPIELTIKSIWHFKNELNECLKFVFEN